MKMASNDEINQRLSEVSVVEIRFFLTPNVLEILRENLTLSSAKQFTLDIDTAL